MRCFYSSIRAFLYLFVALALVPGHAEEETVQPADPVWLYAQFNVPESSGYIESYWYYGLVDGDLFAAISSNEVTAGFITLEQVRYWGDNDAIALYEDQVDTGSITFRIEHLVKYNPMKMPLEEGFSYSENIDIVDDRPDVEPPSPTLLD